MTVVAYDRQAFIRQSYGGISRYFSTLYESLAHNENIQPKYLFRAHGNNYIRRHYNDGVFLSRPISRLYQQTLAGVSDFIHCSLSDFDILHTTHYFGKPPALSRKYPHVVTIYDMAPEMLPEYFLNKKPHGNKLEWLEAADSIISISQSSAKDLSKIAPHLSSKIKSIHLCSFLAESPSPFAQTPLSADLPNRPFILYIGPRYGYKNFLDLAHSYSAVFSASSASSPLVVCIGGKSFSPKEKTLLHQLEVSSNFVQISPTDEQLVAFYRQASAVVIPSKFEGFSLPLVEALHFDTPILCSNIPVHYEVASTFATIASTNTKDWLSALSAYGSLPRPSYLLGDRYSRVKFYYSPKRLTSDHVSHYHSLI